MDINFTKVDGAYVSEFEVTADFNLHMDDILLKDVTIYQRSAGTGYDVVRDVPTFPIYAKVFDYDFSALVYPKYIKVVCNTEPSYASVVTDGEITEIKSQSKSVDVTSNGVTEVTPDSGYSYLTGVSVNVNVPQEGGGGNNWEYLKFSSEYALANLNLPKLIGIQGGVSLTANGNTAYAGGLIAYDFIRQLEQAIEYGLTINYVTIKTDLSMMVFRMGTNSMYSLNDYLVSLGISQSDIDSWERITEEEFYNTEA